MTTRWVSFGSAIAPPWPSTILPSGVVSCPSVFECIQGEITCARQQRLALRIGHAEKAFAGNRDVERRIGLGLDAFFEGIIRLRRQHTRAAVGGDRSGAALFGQRAREIIAQRNLLAVARAIRIGEILRGHLERPGLDDHRARSGVDAFRHGSSGRRRAGHRCAVSAHDGLRRERPGHISHMGCQIGVMRQAVAARG
jgi:hypothetical protein